MEQMNKEAKFEFDIVCIGNAVIDLYNIIEESKLKEMNLVPGSMNLINEQTAKELYKLIPHDQIFPGGSAANTAIGIASFGGKVKFIGKLKDDSLGKIFYDTIIKENISFICDKASKGAETGQSYILISKHDKERTMCTYLGAASNLSQEDIDESKIIDCKMLFIEGYLWDSTKPREAAMKALDIAKKNDVKIAFTLSDKSCIAKHKSDFHNIVFNQADIIFGNKKEAFELFETNDFNELIKLAQEKCKIFIFTLGAEGSIIITSTSVDRFEVQKSIKVADTTGAGDSYAAGVLYGLCKDFDLKECARIGNIASSENVTHIGTHPQILLKSLL
jgi:sugar/nucleoside kinase (ribokinase family)